VCQLQVLLLIKLFSTLRRLATRRELGEQTRSVGNFYHVRRKNFLMRIPFVNLWISYLLQNPSFSAVKLPKRYELIGSIRGKALIALRQGDATWVRSFREGIDVVGPWDKRSVLYASSLLSRR
jgi:hypothetical protein